MKPKKPSKKLGLNKNTIANLNSLEKSKIKGGMKVSVSCPEIFCVTNEYNCTWGCPSQTACDNTCVPWCPIIN